MINPSDTYKSFAAYYNLYVGKFTADLDFYLSLCHKEDKILEVGCGTGRILKKFLENDFRITGIDISKEMLDIADTNLKVYIEQDKLHLLIHDLSVKPTTDCFDIVLVTFYTFNYIIINPEVFTRNLYNSMAHKSQIIFDLFYPKSYMDSSIDGKWFETPIHFDNRSVLLQDKRSMKGNIEYRSQIYLENETKTSIETERRYYSPSEINKLLKTAGFKNIRFTSSYNKDQFTYRIDEQLLKTNYLIIAEK